MRKQFGRHTRTVATLMLLAGAVSASADHERSLPTWLVGCWLSEDAKSLEAWTQDSDDTLIGFSSVVRENQVVFYELMSIRLDDASGELTFTAYPSNQPGGSFPAAEQEEEAVVFLNPEHDYPQRIRYQRDGDRLLADIARSDGEQTVDFTKTACK